MQDAITVEDYKYKSYDFQSSIWRNLIRTSTVWLTDSLMNTAQMLLKKVNPAMQGKGFKALYVASLMLSKGSLFRFSTMGMGIGSLTSEKSEKGPGSTSVYFLSLM